MSGLTSTDKQALKLFTQELHRAFPERVETVELFGSKARGDAAKHSDVDILVVLNEPRSSLASRERVYSIASRIQRQTGVVLSPKVLARPDFDQLRAWGEPLLLNIERDGVRL